MLNERFFVPVLRSTDGSIPPQIGKPFAANEPPVSRILHFGAAHRIILSIYLNLILLKYRI